MNYCFDYVRPKHVAEFKNKAAKDHYKPSALSVHTYANALLVPGGMGPCSGIYVKGTVIPYSSFEFSVQSNCDIETSLERDEEVFYLGMFDACWGHCLGDNLRHIWPVVRGTLALNVKFVYMTSAPEIKLPTNFIAMLKAIGIDLTAAEKIVRPMRFSKLHMADPSYWLSPEFKGRYYSKEFEETIDAIRSKFLGAYGERLNRVYFSRAGWKTAKPDIGERLLELAFRNKGYEIVHPEELTIEGLINMLANCREFVATDGSCAHNAIFSPRGAKLVVLRKASYVNDVQMVFNQMRDLDVTIVDAYRDDFLAYPSQPWLGPFYLCVNKYLARFLDCETAYDIVGYFAYFCSFVRMRTRICISSVKHGLLKW